MSIKSQSRRNGRSDSRADRWRVPGDHRTDGAGTVVFRISHADMFADGMIRARVG